MIPNLSTEAITLQVSRRLGQRLLNAIYFFRIIEQMFIQREASLTEVHPHKGKLGLPLSMVIPILVGGIMILVLGFYSVDIVTDVVKLGLPEVFLR